MKEPHRGDMVSKGGGGGTKGLNNVTDDTQITS